MIGNRRQRPEYPGMYGSRYAGSLGQLILRSINWGIVVGILLVFGIFGWILWQNRPAQRR